MKRNKLGTMLGLTAGFTLLGSVARADFTPQTYTVFSASTTNKAPVTTDSTGVTRLKRTRNNESQEQSVVAMFADGKTGLVVQMQNDAIVAGGQKAFDRTQLGCFPVKLVQNADGSVGAASNGTPAFVTANQGQDYRNDNHPKIYPINGGQHMLITYNARINGSNNTQRWAKVVDNQCVEQAITGGKNTQTVQDKNGKPQVLIMAKNNDDCDMSQSDTAGDIATDAGGVTHVTMWAGCNGNGRDDGWVNDVTVTAQTDGSFTIDKNFDVDVEPNEERTRGKCTVAAADPNTAICTWTAGNDEPQTDGTWIGAIDIGPGGATGEDAQGRLLWKKQIDGKKLVQGVKTYSVRANQGRLLTTDSTGALTKSNMLFIQTSDLRGNNTNNKKGGRYLQMNLGVAQADATGLKWVIPMTDVTAMMLGTDATHLTQVATLVEDNGKVLPALAMHAGSENGGGTTTSSEVKFLAADLTAGKFVDYGTHPAGGSYDRHLYSQYLGQNPNNQGRNFAGALFTKNPFPKVGGPSYLLLNAITGKDPSQLDPSIKTSTYLSIMPTQNPTATPPPPPGMPNTTNPGTTGTGGGVNSQPQAGDPNPANNTPAMNGTPGTPGTPGNFSSGCSMAGNGAEAGAGGMMILLGLSVLFLVRRRWA
jgi:hypothetical protein